MISRWISVICCGIVAASVILIIVPFIRALSSPLVDTLSVLPPSMLSLVWATLLGAACWFSGRGRWRGFVGLRFFARYPPLWFAVLIGLGGWLGAAVSLEGAAYANTLAGDVLEFGKQEWWLLALLVISVVGIIYAGERSVRASGEGRADETGPEVLSNDFDALRSWVQDDKEITSPSRDRFGHDGVAQRITQRLNRTDVPTMAVIGPLGSGKSSIRRLVAYHLKRRPTVRLIEVSLWPFDSPEAAVRGILQAVVQELGRHVNVLPLSGLSEDYVAAIEETVGQSGGFARLLRTRSDPEQTIQRLSKIAGATGLRFVLWVEDLERFSGGDQLDGAARADREVEKLGPIRALLHQLDRCPEISVIISDTSLHTRFDIGKIARFVEQPPAMDVQSVWAVIDLLRTRCLGGHPLAVIDPTQERVRQEFALTAEHQTSAWLSSVRESNPSLPAAIVRVLKTPRALKWALRSTLETWETIPGEIDFDSVLVTSVIKVSRPDLFALVGEHIELFKQGFRNPIRPQEGQSADHRVVDRTKELLSREDERTGAALAALLSFLFPAYAAHSQDNINLSSHQVARPQALFTDSHADYWRRYLAHAPINDEDSDQEALRSVDAWLKQEPSDLIERILEPKRSAQVVSFVGQFQPNDLCRLLNEVGERLRGESARDWDHGSHAPGISSIWQMMQSVRPDPDAVFEAVSDVVRRSASAHLPLALDISRFFADASPSVPALIDDSQQHEIKRILQDTSISSFTGEGAEERLRTAVRDGAPWVVSQISFLRGSGANGQGGVPFERWPEFAQVLLNLAEEQPDAGVPYLIPFVTWGNMGMSGWVANFDSDQANRLFDLERLVPILASFEVPNDLDGQMKAQCRAAVEAAKSMDSAGDGPSRSSSTDCPN